MQAGAPPDAFGIKGQNWSFPTYNWPRMQTTGFAWWKQRFEQMGEYFVFVARDTIIVHGDHMKPKPNKEEKPPAPSLHALQKKVTVGQTLADRIIVKSGLQNGDRIVVDGIQKLHDGSKITTANFAMPGPNGGHK